MTPEETIVLLECSESMPGTVYRVLGFPDADFAQDGCEAMLKAVDTYVPNKGSSLKTWLMLKARYGIVESYRRRFGLRKSLRPEFTQISESYEYDEFGFRIEASVDPEIEIFENRFDAALVTPKYKKVLATFSLPHQSMIRARVAGQTMASIGADHGVTESRVSQLMTKFRGRYNGNAYDKSKELLRAK